MKKIQYFFAAVYQKLLQKKPNGTPYLNLRLGIAFILLLHYSQIAVYLKSRHNIFLLPNSTTLLLTMGVTISVILFYVLGLIIPLEIISEIEVTQKQKNLCYYIFGTY